MLLIFLWMGWQFVGYSAGSKPVGHVNPLALELLRHQERSIEGLRSKSWDEFVTPGVPELDFIISLPIHSLDRLTFKEKLAEIGRIEG